MGKNLEKNLKVEGFNPKFEIVEDNLVSLKCRCSCATPGACPYPKCYSTESPSAEYTEVNSERFK